MILNTTISDVNTVLISAVNETAVLSMFICNTDVVDHVIDIYCYPNGSVANDSNILLKNYVISAGDTFVWTSNEKIILQPLAKISAKADLAGKVVATVNYKELV